jgi:hypothetical protein
MILYMLVAFHDDADSFQPAEYLVVSFGLLAAR